jgi:pantoate--beta-alanine ligase
MDVIRTRSALRARCDRERDAGRSVGLVPTMGALHAGHAALLRRARTECGVVVMSLFVNPLQFGDPADLAAYPRDEAHDLREAERLGTDVVFAPDEHEMYPEGRTTVAFDPGELGKRLEGERRPGHFRGVATIVALLLRTVGPCTAYFGEKDAQQLAVVRRLVAELDLPVDLVECPTVRDPDGLALSSRNVRLSPAQRDAATCLFLALSEAASLARAGETDASVLVAAMAREIGATQHVRLDYAALVDPDTFEGVREIRPPQTARAVVAADVGGVHLVDTLRLPLPGSVGQDGSAAARPARAPAEPTRPLGEREG